jgi:hypothetical protein
VTGTEKNGMTKRATLFLYKSTGFSLRFGRKEKDEEDGLESGRQPLKSSAQQWSVLK